jgi:hypothetical protein
MRVEWYGQSAFSLEGDQGIVFIDPFGDMSAISNEACDSSIRRSRQVTSTSCWSHEHVDHNGVEAVGGEPEVIRSVAAYDSPVGEVVAIASEHDDAAGPSGARTRSSSSSSTGSAWPTSGLRAGRPALRTATGDR